MNLGSMVAAAGVVLILPALMFGQAAGGAGKPVALKAQPFSLSQVRLLEGPFREAMLRDKAYLLSLDPERMLHTFRLTAGLPTTAQPYGGWEAPKCELRGHCMGHYLTALALMYASTGDEKLKARAEYLVAELAKCQQALPAKGYNKGFLSAYPESFFDRVDQCKPVWAPYYTLHKILAGLLDVYEQCGDKQALDVLEQMAAWLKVRVDKLGHEQQQKALGNEHGGMNEVLANLYAVTGKPEHLALAREFNHEAVFGPLAAGQDKLDGLHANTQVPKMIGAAREYELTGETTLRDVAAHFWKFVAEDRSYAIGGHSDSEHFFPVSQFARHLSPVTAETCNTYNMLKLTRHLFAWEPSARTMDFYERALFNQILGSQDPDKGMMMYFASLKPGHFKVYNTPEESFWCCTGTGLENHAKYGDTIYFHDGQTLFWNLLIASELTWKDKGLVVRQETAFPDKDTAKLVFHCETPVELTLKIRRPFWAKGMTVAVNGQAQAVEAGADSYVAIKRSWKQGDQVELRLPMELRTEALPGNADIVALCYGPLVLAGQLGTQDMPSPYVHRQTDLNKAPAPAAPIFLCDVQNLLKHVQAVAGKELTFATQGVGRPNDVTLIPYFRMHHQRFSVYWQVTTEEGLKKIEEHKAADRAAAEARLKELEKRLGKPILDMVVFGNEQSETDHDLADHRSAAGEAFGRHWRDARDGWFRYDLKVEKGQPAVLRCTYWGGDNGRTFDILVEDKKIATQTLDGTNGRKFFDVEYPIPASCTRDKERVVVKFQAHKGSTAGGVFGLYVTKP